MLNESARRLTTFTTGRKSTFNDGTSENCCVLNYREIYNSEPNQSHPGFFLWGKSLKKYDVLMYVFNIFSIIRFYKLDQLAVSCILFNLKNLTENQNILLLCNSSFAI